VRCEIAPHPAGSRVHRLPDTPCVSRTLSTVDQEGVGGLIVVGHAESVDPHGWTSQLAAAAADLALGGVCAGCGTSPGVLCPACRREFEGPSRVLGMRSAGIPVVAMCAYGGAVRSAVLAHKEHGRLGLSRPFGATLAAAVDHLLDTFELAQRPIALVPAPSARTATRRRGHDPLLRVARRAGVVLRRAGVDCVVVPAVGHGRRVSDQAGLGQAARKANLHESMIIRSGAPAMLTNRWVVIVDDVVTTGATIDEVARTLRLVGLEPRGAAVIAATP
jgi:predicted amidophosphoribosyltransferase